MHKLIIFSALIACALATWGPATRQEGQHPHQSIATHGRGVEHAKRNGMAAPPGHNLRTPHGQMESVHHGGGTVFKNKEFKRTKKGHHENVREERNGQRGNLREEKGRNHLRRARSDKRH